MKDQNQLLSTIHTCTKCGNEIAGSPPDDALCVRCRYETPGKSAQTHSASEFDIAVETTAAPPPERNTAERLVELLAVHGVDAPRGLVLDVERFVHLEALKIASEAASGMAFALLRGILDKLPKNIAWAVVLRRVVFGPSGESTRQAAVRCKVSHTAIQKAEKRLKRLLKIG